MKVSIPMMPLPTSDNYLKTIKTVSQPLRAAIEVMILLVNILSKRLGLNSRNSSKPPSTDLLVLLTESGSSGNALKQVRSDQVHRRVSAQPQLNSTLVVYWWVSSSMPFSSMFISSMFIYAVHLCREFIEYLSGVVPLGCKVVFIAVGADRSADAIEGQNISGRTQVDAFVLHQAPDGFGLGYQHSFEPVVDFIDVPV